jgi:prevent-host-death family protein
MPATKMQYSVADAKNKLTELIKAVEDGDSITICRGGLPIVDIVRTKRPTRKKRSLGTLKGKTEIIDPNWWKPMTAKRAVGTPLSCARFWFYAVESPERLTASVPLRR